MQTATSYEAHAFPDGTPPTERPPLQVAAEPTFRADGLEPDTLMGIFVRAIRETAGDRVVGPWSDYGTGKTLPPPEPEPPPGQPTGIRVVDAGTDFLVWAWDPVETATGYEAHAFPDGTPPTERPPLQVTVEPTFRADGLEPDTLTRILVRAIRETAEGRAAGPWSDHGTGRTLPPPLPEIGSPCPGVVVRGDPPREWQSVSRATLLIDWEQQSGGSLGWAGPYHDDEHDVENRRRTPLLEVNVAEWRVETIEGATRHTLEIEWPRFREIALHFRSDAGNCELPTLGCRASGCELRP